MSDRDAIRRSRSLLRELSASDAQLAERALEQDEKRRRKILDAQARDIENAEDDAERRLSTLVGKRELPALRRALRDEHLKVRGLLQPPKGLGRDPSQLNAARKRKGDALAQRIRSQARQAEENQRDISEAGAENCDTFRQGRPRLPHAQQPRAMDEIVAAPSHAVALGAIPPLAPADPGPFSLFRPPFFDWPDRFEKSQSNDTSVSRQHFSHAFAGYVGHDTSMTVDGDPFAGAGMVVETRMGFIFDAPAAGPLEIIVDATNATGTHDIRTTNEWGWSDTDAEQINYLTGGGPAFERPGVFPG